jgi:5,6-dimethylbenzimidazole synthase
MAGGGEDAAPAFGAGFREAFATLCAWRRDVRRFLTDPVPETMLDHLLDMAQLSPSVGNSQPWRWVRVDSPHLRAAVQGSFRACNAEALAGYSDTRAQAYAALKLEGLGEAPVQFAVFCDRATAQGLGLGRRTMPETLDYSVVSSITTFWLAARMFGLGVGWVSILDPKEVGRALAVPAAWHLVAYLCVGWPVEEHADPELERAGWQSRTGIGRDVLRR